MDDCVDDATFDNGSGATCAAYSQWCADGGARPGSEWALGAQFNHPERHCCACGKKGEDAEPVKTVDDDAETGHISPRGGAISPISHGPSGSTMVKVEPSGAPAAIDQNDL